MIITLTMNPAVDKTAEVNSIKIGGLNRLQNSMMDAGGKGINVSKTIQSLDGKSIALGIVAGSTGMYIESELDKMNIEHDFLRVAGNTRTNLKVVDEDRVLSEFNESGPTISSEDLNKLTKKIESILKENDVFVISGSVSGGVPKNYYETLISLAKSKKVTTILDADGDLFKEGVKAIPTIIKPNRYELAQYFGIEEEMDEATLIAYANKFIEQGVELVVVSMGKEGSYFICKDAVYFAKALKVDAHSSVGAGDAMVASLAYGYENGYDIKTLIQLCVACSAGAVMTKGTKPAEYTWIKEKMKDVEYEKK